MLNQQVQSLTEDLAKKSEEVNNLRREHTNNIITLRTQLAEKTEEVTSMTHTFEEMIIFVFHIKAFSWKIV